MKHAFELLAKIKFYGRKIAVLGDMFELGDQSAKLHLELARHIKRNGIDSVYTIGNFMKKLNSVLNENRINNIHFRNRQELNKFLNRLHLDNSVVLVKGSRGMKMEEFVKTIESRVND